MKLPIAALLVPLLAASSAVAQAKPNIVYIMADDLGYADVGCYGQELIRTPRIDRMAAEGMRFTQHYSGNNVCAPTRCSLMTGKHPGHAFIRGNKQAPSGTGQLPLPDNAITVAEVLQNAGYTTGMFGKWGLGEPGTSGDPLAQGWDTYFGYTDQVRAHNYFPDFLLRDGERVALDNEVVYLSKDAWHKGLGSYSTRQNVYSHDEIERAALEFIRAEQNRPFFLYLPVTPPHDNGEAPELVIEVPDFTPYENEDWSPNNKAYAAIVTRLDATVGRVLDLLTELELEEDTLVLFTSDNGPYRPGDRQPDRRFTEFFDSNGPLRGYKRDMYEGGIRAPLVAWWPGTVPPGSTSDHISAHWDFFPTAAELAGATPTSGLDGISFVPELNGDTANQRNHEFLYWEDTEQGGVAVRQGRWKGVIPAMEKNPSATFEIYDLESDPGESRNLAPDQPDRVAAFDAIVASARVPSEEFPHPIDARLTVSRQ